MRSRWEETQSRANHTPNKAVWKSELSGGPDTAPPPHPPPIPTQHSLHQPHLGQRLHPPGPQGHRAGPPATGHPQLQHHAPPSGHGVLGLPAGGLRGCPHPVGLCMGQDYRSHLLPQRLRGPARAHSHPGSRRPPAGSWAGSPPWRRTAQAERGWAASAPSLGFLGLERPFCPGGVGTPRPALESREEVAQVL